MKLEQFEQEGKVGFKDDCKIIIPAIYESASYFHDGHAVVRLNGLSGVIDYKGKMVIPNQYDDITHLFEKYFCARINVGADWNCGIIDIDGKSIIEPSYIRLFVAKTSGISYAIKPHKVKRKTWINILKVKHMNTRILEIVYGVISKERY